MKQTKSKFNKKDDVKRTKYGEAEFDERENKFRGRGKKRVADNDPAWYASNAELLRDAASISFPYAVGTPFNLKGSLNVSNFEILQRSAPGVMAIHYRSVPGVSTDAVSPINVAARNLYSYVRHANSGSANYDSPDLMLYFLAMDSIYAWYAELCRAYGVARTYSMRNKYMPTQYLKALGFDPTDIIQNLANLRYYINLLCVKIGALAVPSNSSYMARHIWMNTHLFADAPGTRYQTYAYVPEGYYQFDEMTYETGGALIFKLKPDIAMKFSDIVAYSEELLNPILASEDMGIMSGDILKAFGSNIVTLSPIAEDYAVGPEYTMEVLSQIHNTRLIGVVNAEDDDIHQDVNRGTLIYQPHIKISNLDTLEQILDMDDEFPDPGKVMVATRNMAVIERYQNTAYLKYAGSDICTYASLHYAYNNGGDIAFDAIDLTTDTSFILGLTSIDSEEFMNFMNTISVVSLLEQFDHHPAITFSVRGQDAEGYTICTFGRMADTTNATVISDDVLRKLHETAIMSQFNVPNMGTFALSR